MSHELAGMERRWVIQRLLYMDIKWKKVVFKRTRLAYERNNIFVTIKRLAKKYKPDFAGKVYLETVRCYFTISEVELKKCRYNYKGKDTYAFVLSDKYIMASYTHCLLARKAVAFENIELNGLSEVELSMVKLENIREVLFHCYWMILNLKMERCMQNYVVFF